MSSPKWNEQVEDDLGYLLRRTLREEYGQVEPSSGAWDRLVERLNRPAAPARSVWGHFWGVNLLPIFSSLAVALVALVLSAGYRPLYTTTTVSMKLAPLRPAVITVRYETTSAAPMVPPNMHLERRYEPDFSDIAILALAPMPGGEANDDHGVLRGGFTPR